MTENMTGTIYVGVLLLGLIGFGVICSVGLHRGADWVTEDVIAPVIFALIIWPIAIVGATLYYGVRAAHAGIGVLVKPRRARPAAAGDPVLAAAEQEVERLLAKEPS